MVVLDSTVLLPFLRPEVGVPLDPQTGAPVANAQARLDYLVKQLNETSTRIGVPSPVLSEVMVKEESAGLRRVRA